nr:MAG TPA: hypothetical protein [Caudoviricetes sp.]
MIIREGIVPELLSRLRMKTSQEMLQIILNLKQ